MKIRKSISIVVLSVLLLAVAGCVQQKQEEINKVESPKFEENSTTESQYEVAELTVNNGTDIKKVNVGFLDGMTAYDVLVEGTKELGLEIKTTEYDFGMAVDAISDDIGGADNKYWMFYINDQMAPAAVDKQEIKAGDKVEFRFEQSSM